MMDSGGGGTVTKADDRHQRIQQQQQQQQEMTAMIQQQQQQAHNARKAVEKHDPREKDDDDDDDCSADSDDEWLNELESDPALEEIREHRLQQLRQEHLHKMELKSKGHGDYRTISQDEFLPETCAAAAAESSKSKAAASEWVVVHFFHDEFIKCKVMDHHLRIVAEKHLECKFLRIEAQKAPFFCSKLKVITLPTVLVLREGTVVDRMVGFEGIAEDNEWPTRLLQKWLAKSGAIDYKPSSREIEEEMERLGISVQKGSIRRGGVRHYDDDDE